MKCGCSEQSREMGLNMGESRGNFQNGIHLILHGENIVFIFFSDHDIIITINTISMMAYTIL
jgi:hypothetical protein